MKLECYAGKSLNIFTHCTFALNILQQRLDMMLNMKRMLCYMTSKLLFLDVFQKHHRQSEQHLHASRKEIKSFGSGIKLVFIQASLFDAFVLAHVLESR